MISTIVGYLLTYGVPALMGWISSKIHTWIVNMQAAKAIDSAAKKSIDDLKKAKTADEIDKATDSTLSGL